MTLVAILATLVAIVVVVAVTDTLHSAKPAVITRRAVQYANWLRWSYPNLDPLAAAAKREQAIRGTRDKLTKDNLIELRQISNLRTAFDNKLIEY